MLSSEEKTQYNRHLILNKIGLEGQLRLKRAKVLVVGAGGLGCPILQYLTAAGVGNIGVLDHDTIDQSNLQRQVLYTHSDIGKSKAETAVKRLTGLNPFVNFNIHNEALDTDNVIEIFEEYDIIVDGTDNFPTRYLINDAAILTEKTLVFGSIFKFDGQVSVFNHKDGPTYRCLYPTPPPPDAVPNCSQIGVLGVLPGLIGTLQANEVIKIICELGDILSGKLLTLNALTLEQSTFTFEKDDAIRITRLEDDYEVLCGITAEVKTMSLVEIKNTIQEPLFLDVRTNQERNNEILIENSTHIPLELLPTQMKTLPKHRSIIVFCTIGQRSKKAVGYLKDNGFENELICLKQ